LTLSFASTLVEFFFVQTLGRRRSRGEHRILLLWNTFTWCFFFCSCCRSHLSSSFFISREHAMLLCHDNWKLLGCVQVSVFCITIAFTINTSLRWSLVCPSRFFFFFFVIQLLLFHFRVKQLGIGSCKQNPRQRPNYALFDTRSYFFRFCFVPFPYHPALSLFLFLSLTFQFFKCRCCNGRHFLGSRTDLGLYLLFIPPPLEEKGFVLCTHAHLSMCFLFFFNLSNRESKEVPRKKKWWRGWLSCPIEGQVFFIFLNTFTTCLHSLGYYFSIVKEWEAGRKGRDEKGKRKERDWRLSRSASFSYLIQESAVCLSGKEARGT